MSNADQFLSENSGDPSFKFTTVGDSIVGTLVATPTRRDGLKYGSDTEVEVSWVFNIETDSGDRYRVFAPVGRQIAKAVARAMAEAKASEFRTGDRIAITYSADGVPSKPGFNPPKLFEAAYKAAYKAAAPSAVAAADLL